MDEITTVTGPNRTPALRSKRKGRGLSLINASLEPVARPLAIAKKCRVLLQSGSVETYLPDSSELREGFLIAQRRCGRACCAISSRSMQRAVN